jgi:hypothetical protein
MNLPLRNIDEEVGTQMGQSELITRVNRVEGQPEDRRLGLTADRLKN